MATSSERIPQLLPMATVTGVCALWALAPSVPIKVEGSAVLLPPDSREGVYARSAGQVQELHRRVGDAVRQGDLLLSINRIDQQAAGGGVVGPGSNALLDQIQAVDRQKQTIQSRIGSLRIANQPVGLQLKALDTLRRDEVIPRYSPLWVGAQDLYLRNENLIKELQAQLAQLDANRAELLAQRNSQSVLAPRDGMLLGLSVNPGQAVIPGQRLATVGLGPEPAAGHQEERTAIALFSDADVARLRPGMPIQLDLQLQTRDRYGGSSQRYGLVEGRIAAIAPASADLAEVSRAVGDPDLASSLIARSRQAAFGEGGDPLATLPDKATSPVRIVTVSLEAADTPSGLRWSAGRGPDLRLENGTPAKSEVVVERRRPLGFLLPFLRWLGGTER